MLNEFLDLLYIGDIVFPAVWFKDYVGAIPPESAIISQHK